MTDIEIANQNKMLEIREVAKKLKEISKFTQVLAITHLPIVASKANHQLFII